jgi:hypothetical protein
MMLHPIMTAAGSKCDYLGLAGFGESVLASLQQADTVVGSSLCLQVEEAFRVLPWRNAANVVLFNHHTELAADHAHVYNPDAL